MRSEADLKGLDSRWVRWEAWRPVPGEEGRKLREVAEFASPEEYDPVLRMHCRLDGPEVVYRSPAPGRGRLL